MVGAKYSRFILQKPHDAVLKEVRSYVGIYSREGVVKKINLFILSIKTPRIFSTQVTTMQAEPSEIQRNKNNEQSRPGIKYATVQQAWEKGIEQKFPNIIGFCPTIKSLNWLPQNKIRSKRRKHFASFLTLTLSLQFLRILNSNYFALKDT